MATKNKRPQREVPMSAYRDEEKSVPNKRGLTWLLGATIVACVAAAFFLFFRPVGARKGVGAGFLALGIAAGWLLRRLSARGS